MAIDRRGIATQGYRTTVERTRLRIATDGYRGDEVALPVGDGIVVGQAVSRRSLPIATRTQAGAESAQAPCVADAVGGVRSMPPGGAQGAPKANPHHKVARARALPTTEEV